MFVICVSRHQYDYLVNKLDLLRENLSMYSTVSDNKTVTTVNLLDNYDHRFRHRSRIIDHVVLLFLLTFEQVSNTLADTGFGRGGPRNLFQDFADVVKWSQASEASQYWLGPGPTLGLRKLLHF